MIPLTSYKLLFAKPHLQRLYIILRIHIVTLLRLPPLIFHCRNPEPDLRPEFTDVLLDLMRPDFKLLTWTAEDVAAHNEQARTLGAPLEAGENLYTDIQKRYVSST